MVKPSESAEAKRERKRLERERMRSLGFVLHQIWVQPKDWPRVRAYIQRLVKPFKPKDWS